LRVGSGVVGCGHGCIENSGWSALRV
jgi:hypothetical protein